LDLANQDGLKPSGQGCCSGLQRRARQTFAQEGLQLAVDQLKLQPAALG
jgi:hypothetical protein